MITDSDKGLLLLNRMIQTVRFSLECGLMDAADFFS